MPSPRPSSDSLPLLAEGYWVESRHPLASLVFIIPFLVVYEVGVLVLGPGEVRNGADAWLRQWLGWIGFGQYFLLPILTVCVLLAWHYTTRQSWRLSRGLLWGMAGECALLAVCLWIVLQVLRMLWPFDEATRMSLTGNVATGVSYLGAGIYEELLFRLILMTSVAWGLKRSGVKPRTSVVAAVVFVSLLFAAAHHVKPHGYPFNGFDFLFRTVAGIFFSILFIYRGYGIAAGTHAGYNLLIGLSPS